MTNYRDAFTIRAQRAVAHGIADARAYRQLAEASGLSLDQVAERLLADLEEEGPIFGKFMRSLRGAAVQSVELAERTGEVLGGLSRDEALRESLSLADLEDVIDDADPGELADVADLAAQEEVMYVAMLENTCDRCLPWHGTVMSRAEFAERGIEPGPGGNMHPGDWNSECKCRFVPVKDIERKEALAPLKRIPKKDEQGRKISGRTVRDVSQIDVDKALKAVEKSRETPEGRRALRWMGKTKADEE